MHTEGGGTHRALTFPLAEALIRRRSRRFGTGMVLGGGPLAFVSAREPVPLTADQEALLVFAACGITGHVFADLPYDSGALAEAGGGTIMTHFVGRTVPSGDAMHVYSLVVFNDEGAWLVRRPQDLDPDVVAAAIDDIHGHRFVAAYERMRVRIADRRPDIPREVPFHLPFNKWSANQPGSTYFLPVAELTAQYLNILLTIFDDDMGYYIVDDHHGYRPAGIGRFAASRGGHLRDDPSSGRFGTLGQVETWLDEFATVELGAMIQSLALMTEALGLAGFPHFAGHPYAWFEALGFRMQQLPATRILGIGRAVGWLSRLLRRDIAVPTAVGFEHDGRVLLAPYAPPYHRDMAAALDAFLDHKDAQRTPREGGRATGWRDERAVLAGIPRVSQHAIDATAAYADYVHRSYGRFPANTGPFRALIAFQAHNPDAEFYRTFYDMASVPMDGGQERDTPS